MNTRKKEINKILIFGIIGIAITGTLLHYVYEWTKCPVFAVIGSANESIWEHTKLVFIPTFAFMITGRLSFAKNLPGFIRACSVGAVLSALFVPASYYLYTGAFGTESVLIDILIFFMAVFHFYLAARHVLYHQKAIVSDSLHYMIMIALLAMFVIFTFSPPHLPVFKDPSTGLYGIN